MVHGLTHALVNMEENSKRVRMHHINLSREHSDFLSRMGKARDAHWGLGFTEGNEGDAHLLMDAVWPTHPRVPSVLLNRTHSYLGV